MTAASPREKEIAINVLRLLKGTLSLKPGAKVRQSEPLLKYCIRRSSRFR